MATYQQSLVFAEFRQQAEAADGQVRALADRAVRDDHSAAAYDENLVRFHVYAFLHARPFLYTREALVSELKWMRDSVRPAPAEALDAERFQRHRRQLVNSLIERFEAGAELPQEPTP